MFLLHATHHIDTPVIKKDFLSDSSMLQSHCSAYNVTYLLQRRMPWLEDRWRTQRTVLHISNCRFPRKIRILNALCELALSTHVVGGDRNMQSSRLLKFGWSSHVVACISADVIVVVSVPFVSSTDCGFQSLGVWFGWFAFVCSFKHFSRTFTTNHGVTRWI